ncbi:hypothetical protein [Clostridium sp.]|uniref:hypothetical protein n=1 Tax=Clostridium sp. TaxID=1506 RepID=UPI00321743AB
MTKSIFFRSVMLFFIGMVICFILNKILSSSMALILAVIFTSLIGSKFVNKNV